MAEPEFPDNGSLETSPFLGLSDESAGASAVDGAALHRSERNGEDTKLQALYE